MAAPQTYNFTTGPSSVPDVGTLSYNGCTFSPLFETKLTCKVVPDEARRITKVVEYTLVADGYVTLPDGQTDTSSTMKSLQILLTIQGGPLEYKGRGCNLSVNTIAGLVLPNLSRAQSGLLDVSWGPVPEILEFQPLGCGRSAKVQWKVVTRVTEVTAGQTGLLQMNYGCTVEYGEDQFSTLSIKGTIEVPMGYGPGNAPQNKVRTLTYTVDNFRNKLEANILRGIDLRRFRMTSRRFEFSRDKRTLEFDVLAVEQPYMRMPPDCTLARGTYNVRPVKAGMGLNAWLCTLKATYTVRNGAPRRAAWAAFLLLVRLRMRSADPVKIAEINEKVEDPGILKRAGRLLPAGLIGGGLELLKLGTPVGRLATLGLAAYSFLKGEEEDAAGRGGIDNAKAKVWLIDFTIDEGLYLDSKTVSFSATWRLLVPFQSILVASGLWTKVPEVDAQGRNLWAASMESVSRSSSWLENRLDPKLDVVVDFGSGV